MLRPRLLDFRASDGPGLIGLCPSNTAAVAAAVNSAQQRLIYDRKATSTGYWGAWAEMLFNVTSATPYLTTPRGIARLERMTVCNNPVPIQNQFYEYLDFGFGRQPQNNCQQGCQILQIYERNVVPTFSDLAPNKKVRVYLGDSSDTGLRTLIQGTDQNDNIIYSQDGLVQVTGEFLQLAAPFVESDVLNSLTGIQKDITNFPVRYYEVDPDTGDQRLILTMEPGETTAAYRRYYLGGLPKNCCNPPSGTVNTVQVNTLAKLEFVPVAVDTDYLTVPNVEALICECQAIRFGNMDEPSAKAEGVERHIQAMNLLQGQLSHYVSQDRPAVRFAPFGSATLRRARVGTMI